MGNLVLQGTDCVYPSMGYGYDYGRRNDDNCDSLKAALHVQEHITSSGLRSDVHNGNLRNADGVRDTTDAIFSAENDLQRALDITNKTVSDAEVRLTHGQNAIGRQIGDAKHDIANFICDVSKEGIRQFAITREQNTNNAWRLSDDIKDTQYKNLKAEGATHSLVNDKFSQINARMDDKFCGIEKSIREAIYKSDFHNQSQHNLILQGQKDNQINRLEQIIDELRHQNACHREDKIKVEITNINNVVGNLATIVQDLVVRVKS